MRKHWIDARFKYTPDYLEYFTYDNLVNAIGDAIDKQAAEDDGKFVTSERTTAYQVDESKSYDELMHDIKELIKKIQSNTGAEFKTKWQPKITAITDKYLGVGKKVNDCTPMQTEQLELIYTDLADEVANGL